MTDDFMKSPEFQALIKEYLEYLSSSLPTVRTSLSDDLYQDVYKFGHNIKGTGTSYGFESLSKLGAKICEDIKGESYDGLEKHLNDVEAVIQEALS
jgi:HPt (histidine-containing phosphotransfer) domain-containing protein